LKYKGDNMSMDIQGKLINGEVCFSINTIKNILYQDIIIMEEESMTRKEYILNLIERFNNIKIG